MYFFLTFGIFLNTKKLPHIPRFRVSCSVRSPVSRPSPKLASSRLRQRLFGAAASQTSRRKPCYRQSDLFSNHHGVIFYKIISMAFICTLRKPPLLLLKGSSLSQLRIQNFLTDTQMVRCYFQKFIGIDEVQGFFQA